jgi:biotin synthase
MNRSEIFDLLAVPESHPDALALRRKADALSRKRFGNKRLLLGQIGVEAHGCPGQCRFCTFAKDVFATSETLMDVSTVVETACRFTGKGELGALFLMTMHDYNKTKLLKLIHAVRQATPEKVNIVLNTGDTSEDDWKEYKDAGVFGAYHVLRLREGTDTQLSPTERKKTIAALRKAGLNWFYCCEPIGPEHTLEEIADAILLGNEFGCFQHAAMARVNFPNAPLTKFGEISKERLAQIVAVVALASETNAELRSVAVHEPDILSLRSGANSVYAEVGVNPRDVSTQTETNRGRSVADLNNMLAEAGWDE